MAWKREEEPEHGVPSPPPPEAQAPERSRKHLSQDPGAWGPVPPRFQVHWPGPEVSSRARFPSSSLYPASGFGDGPSSVNLLTAESEPGGGVS